MTASPVEVTAAAMIVIDPCASQVVNSMRSAAIQCQTLPHVPWFHLQVGIFSVLTGLAAVVMSLKENPSWKWKGPWLLAIFLFTAAELRMIVWSDADAAAEREHASCQTEKNFQAVERESEQQFLETTCRVGHLFDKTSEAADAAKEGVVEMTGAGTFLTIFPHGQLLNGKPIEGIFALFTGVIGKHTVWDGRVFMRDGPLSDPNYLFKPAQEFDLRPVVPTQPDSFGKSIQPSKEGVTSYNFSLVSRGTFVLEQLDIQFNAKANQWEYKYVIWEPQSFKKTPKPTLLIKKTNWTAVAYPRLL